MSVFVTLPNLQTKMPAKGHCKVSVGANPQEKSAQVAETEARVKSLEASLLLMAILQY